MAPKDKQRSRPEPERDKGRRASGISVYLLVAALGVLLLNSLGDRHAAESLPYSKFQQHLEKGQVKEVVVTGDRIRGEIHVPDQEPRRFETVRVDEPLAEDLSRHGVEYSAAPESVLLPALVTWLLPVGLIIGFWYYIFKRAAKMGPPGMMAVGKSKAKVYIETDTKVTFKDVAGIDEAKEELQEIVSFLKDPASHGRLGARMPRGILLVGPPGTGKTLLARAVAGEAGVPFLSISGSEFVEMFVGVGAARVRDMFEEARQRSPCIIFIDELDALGRARMAHPGMPGHDEKEQTLNQLLAELDGFDPRIGIVLLGATNRPEVLDPALLRSGRFDRQILVDKPDKRGRAAILRVHMTKIKLSKDVSVEEIAALTPGFTGADLANLVNEAALVATRRGATEVTMGDFNAGIERIVAGLEKKNRLLNPVERRVVAHHEMGHALVASALPGTDAVHKISIIPRGIGALGYTIQRPTDDRYLMNIGELENKMAVLLGGRAAEDLIFDHLSTGASDDLVKATDIARSMVTRYAMIPELGHIAYDTDPPGFLGPAMAGTRRLYSEETAREIDCAVRAVAERAFRRARSILEKNRAVLEEGAHLLLDKETLDADDIEMLFRRIKKEASPLVALTNGGGTATSPA